MMYELDAMLAELNAMDDDMEMALLQQELAQVEFDRNFAQMDEMETDWNQQA